MASKKSAPSKKGTSAPRGLELVERVIDSLETRSKEERRKLFLSDPGPRPKADAIAKMRLANGAPLPPSLQRFLAYHGPANQFPGLWQLVDVLELEALALPAAGGLVDREARPDGIVGGEPGDVRGPHPEARRGVEVAPRLGLGDEARSG